MRFLNSWTVLASVGSSNKMNKLSLVGMQLPEKYKENVDGLSEALRLELLAEVRKTRPSEAGGGGLIICVSKTHKIIEPL